MYGEEALAPKILQSETYFEFSLLVRCIFEKTLCVLLILARKQRVENNPQTFCSTTQTYLKVCSFKGKTWLFGKTKTVFPNKFPTTTFHCAKRKVKVELLVRTVWNKANQSNSLLLLKVPAMKSFDDRQVK